MRKWKNVQNETHVYTEVRKWLNGMRIMTHVIDYIIVIQYNLDINTNAALIVIVKVCAQAKLMALSTLS